MSSKVSLLRRRRSAARLSARAALSSAAGRVVCRLSPARLERLSPSWRTARRLSRRLSLPRLLESGMKAESWRRVLRLSPTRRDALSRTEAWAALVFARGALCREAQAASSRRLQRHSARRPLRSIRLRIYSRNAARGAIGVPRGEACRARSSLQAQRYDILPAYRGQAEGYPARGALPLCLLC